LPPFAELADDVQCSRAVLACTLGVSRSTLQRWIADDEAPRVARLAVFWLTRWGQSALDADAYNSAAMHASMARALRDELIAAQKQIARLRRALDAVPSGSANSPVYSGVDLMPVIEAGNR
jgi:predicted DNA-binding transcriptional regulator AlpA